MKKSTVGFVMIGAIPAGIALAGFFAVVKEIIDSDDWLGASVSILAFFYIVIGAVLMSSDD